MGPPTTATEVLPNGGPDEAPPDKLLLHLHRMAVRTKAISAGPTGSFMRWLGSPQLMKAPLGGIGDDLSPLQEYLLGETARTWAGVAKRHPTAAGALVIPGEGVARG